MNNRFPAPLPSRQDGPSKLGRAMLFGAWVVGMVLLASLFQNYLSHRENPNQDLIALAGPDGMTQVVLQQNRDGHYVATGTINGEPVVFLLDTGATTVSLPQGLARRLGLALRPGGMSKTANGMVQTWTTHLNSVSLGGLVAHNLRATVLPNFPGDQVLLGMDFLKRFELIQRGGELTIRLPS
ncbi:MAG: retropepsin-like aspartic protease [Lamprobacter sp.]|uniref:retropepsin-like aspartic protease family protein n=1 Tax=Lamprobacter sp. TaxID=3100796 RepID=UPI002B25B395|nr:retropepsin-like aspartic protease [Lamprobacter sp.]MEA3642555.1 retropepsin-like aspartic protease [Lamprobacter sp.]